MLKGQRAQKAFAEHVEMITGWIAEKDPFTWAEVYDDLVDPEGGGLSAKMADEVLGELVKRFPEAAVAEDVATPPREDWLPCPENPGYAIDQFQRMKSLGGGRGRGAGKILTPIRQWWKSEDGKKFFKNGFRFRPLGGSGKRVFVTCLQVGINRHKAELNRRRDYAGE
jgi:hypothetical protein